MFLDPGILLPHPRAYAPPGVQGAGCRSPPTATEGPGRAVSHAVCGDSGKAARGTAQHADLQSCSPRITSFCGTVSDITCFAAPTFFAALHEATLLHGDRNRSLFIPPSTHQKKQY